MGTETSNAGGVTRPPRVTVEGKFFRLGAAKFPLKGVAYGPLAPNERGEPFGSPEATRRDFGLIRGLGANLLRLYDVPPRWLLDLALEHDLRLLIDVPWHVRHCFLDTAGRREAVRGAVRDAARACAGHPAVFALSVANEIPPEVIRWSGADAMQDFLDDLIEEVKAIAPECLCTFGNFPPSEHLHSRQADFACFNVYLHRLRPFRSYLARLQMLADTRPLVLGELGMDTRREGETRQAGLLRGQVELAFRGGAAGVVVYSFTDEWFKDGARIDDWEFGLTTRDRQPKAAYHAVAEAFRLAPAFRLPRSPAVSVVVAAYNAARTLRSCLESLERLNGVNYEVILVDDGSTDATAQIAAGFPEVRLLRHPTNLGLSVARNTGIAAAQGEIVAFTDADCRADEDWLYHLVHELVTTGFVGVGGHNLLPPDDSTVAAAVLVSPGGPAHVMLNDRVAEHIPGCNMAFWKWALVEIGGFDPMFRRAGDDVDVCWRLQQRGYRLGFSPAGFVWHYRRSTVRAYLDQQRGYGEAEALLEQKHPENFNPLGGGIWRGRIYTASAAGLLTRRPMIYRGLFGSGAFQGLYPAPQSPAVLLATSLEYHVLVTLPLLVVSAVFRWLLPVALASLALSVGVCVFAAARAEIPRRKRHAWSRPLVALLFALQPIVRGWARYRGRLTLRRTPLARFENLDSLSRDQQGLVPDELAYRTPAGFSRVEFLVQAARRLDELGWVNRTDAGWNQFDFEVYGSRWAKLQLTTVLEETGQNETHLRCRLRPALTLSARLAFWGLLGTALTMIGLAGRVSVWPWLLLLLLPLFALWHSRQQRDLQRLLSVFLDDTAKAAGLVKLDPPPS